ncbi:DNA-binding domain-containing protein [Halomonas sp. DP8Y7-1]|uniref:HvfC/BufC family peptide modification chaperone n=1 Tax=Halomonas sp. DP8Y7-1 TaxID=2859078 RepID=UPI001C95F04D|nr:putative DNA-binding domain-containing protein [Halomonas sp. DP8Y7-1]MBY6028284.1 DNA-binding domain-containing protein [Halomonas sp. DP8Y7-1]
MSRLQDWQRHFIDAVRQPHRPSSPIADTPGLDVYRNNIRSSLIEALKDTFPHTLTLLGERCFVGEASRFVAHHPPRDPRLAHYGGDFVTALRQSPDVSRYRFVADIAGLEHARLRVSHAADSIPLEACELGACLDSVSCLVQALPASRCVSCEHDVEGLWQALERGEGSAPLGSQGPGHWLLVRHGQRVQMTPIDDVTANLHRRLDGTTSLAQALGEMEQELAGGLRASDSLDDLLGRALGTLVGQGALFKPAEAFHQPAEAFHKTAEALHQPAEALHKTAEALHKTAEALHQPAEAQPPKEASHNAGATPPPV